MSDSDQANTWPHYRDPPPLSDTSPLTAAKSSETAASRAPQVRAQQSSGPQNKQATVETPAPNTWPHYRLPPDLDDADATKTAAGQPPPPAAAMPSGLSTDAPAAARRTVPPRAHSLLVMGMLVFAFLIGLTATLLIVRPWASTTSDEDRAIPYPYAPTRSDPPPITGNASVPIDPGAALTQQAANDRSIIATIPDGYWVPQFSSKRVGLIADGIIYTKQDVWNDHR